jgi:hypothetical protein
MIEKKTLRASWSLQVLTGGSTGQAGDTTRRELRMTWSLEKAESAKDSDTRQLATLGFTEYLQAVCASRAESAALCTADV